MKNVSNINMHVLMDKNNTEKLVSPSLRQIVKNVLPHSASCQIVKHEPLAFNFALLELRRSSSQL